MGSALKSALEDLLRARRLHAEGPPLRGEDRRARRLSTGLPGVDQALCGGFPRGCISQIQGATSSGRTGLALALVAQGTQAGGLAAWLDPGDRLDPASAAASGVDLARLLWLRGDPLAPCVRTLQQTVAALGTLVGSGLFEIIVFDLSGIPPAEIQRLPAATWIRLQRVLETTAVALVVLADGHTAQGPGGLALTLQPGQPSWTGVPGPGRLLQGLGGQIQVGRHDLRSTRFALIA